MSPWERRACNPRRHRNILRAFSFRRSAPLQCDRVAMTTADWTPLRPIILEIQMPPAQMLTRYASLLVKVKPRCCGCSASAGHPKLDLRVYESACRPLR
jgi:hypothetical protein